MLSFAQPITNQQNLKMRTTRIILITLITLTASLTFGQKVELANLKNPTIKAFISGINGSEQAAEGLIAQYANAAVKENGMIPTGKFIKVHSETDNCAIFSTLWVIEGDKDEDGEVMEYEICEEGGEITTFDLLFDYEEGEEE